MEHGARKQMSPGSAEEGEEGREQPRGEKRRRREVAEGLEREKERMRSGAKYGRLQGSRYHGLANLKMKMKMGAGSAVMW